MAAPRMRSDRPFKVWLVQKNNRERRDAANPPSVVVPDNISWVDTPPATGSANTDYTASWQGGFPPYYAEIKNNSVLLNAQTGPYTQMVLNVDGTNQPLGAYEWTVRDAKGTEITGSTIIS